MKIFLSFLQYSLGSQSTSAPITAIMTILQDSIHTSTAKSITSRAMATFLHGEDG